MSASTMPLSQGRPAARRKRNFIFNKGDLVLVKWADGMVYFAKIKHIYHRREKCVVVFDDKSQDEADFSQIHSVDETTTDIICIKCKKDDSDSPNEIVLCDKCGIGFHQKCHNPTIPASALQLDSPWICSYCQRGIKCPYLNESITVLQNWLSDDNESVNGEESCNGMESDEDNIGSGDTPKQKKSLRIEAKTSTSNDKKRALRGTTPTTVSSLATTVLREKSQNDVSNLKNLSLSEGEDVSAEVVSSSRKRKKYTPLHKRQKRPSVESHTVSVTRLDSPIFSDTMNTFPPSIKEDKSVKVGSPKPKHEKRSLRVSLSLPEEMDKSNFKGRNGTTGVLSNSTSPTLDSTATSPTCELSKHVTSLDMVVEEEKCEDAFVASSLPVVTSQEQGETSHPSSSTEVVEMDDSPKPAETVTDSTGISSCQSPPAEVPADSSTNEKYFPADKSEQDLAATESNSPNNIVEDKIVENGVSNSGIDEKATATPVLSAAVDSIDTAAVPVPTTLPVIISRSMCYPSSEGMVSPTKPIVSSDDLACEAGESICAQLTPISTGCKSFSISQIESKDNDVGTGESQASASTADSATSIEATDQNKKTTETDSAGQVATDDDHHNSTPVSVSKPNDSLTSVSNKVSVLSSTVIPSVPTSVITSSILVPKPQSIPLKPSSGMEGEMSQLDKQLAAVIGYEEEMESRDDSSQSKEVAIVQTTVPTSSSSDSVTSSTQKSGQIEVAYREEQGGEDKQERTISKVESTKMDTSASAVDPDVIITSVEPSKEYSKADASQPANWNVDQVSSGSRSSLLQSKTSTASIINQVPQDSSKVPPPPYPGHSVSEPSGVKSPPTHATHALYSPGTRVPVGYQSRTNSVIYTPNGQAVYYSPVQQENNRLALKPGYPGGVPTSKAYGANRIAADARNVDARKMGGYMVVDGGVVQQIVPVSPLSKGGGYRMPPDSTISTESPVGAARASSTITSPSDERDKIPRKKFAQKDIQFIQKKLGDACNSYDVSEFMAAFNEAWQKFQANASNYPDQAMLMNSRVALGQAPDGSQQIQLVSTKPRVVAPKLSSSATESIASSPASPSFGSAVSPVVSQIQPHQQPPLQQQYVFQQIPNAPQYMYAIPAGAVAAAGHPSHSHSATQPKTGGPPATIAMATGSVQSETLAIQSNSSPALGQSSMVNHFRTSRAVVQQAKVPPSPVAAVNGGGSGMTKAAVPPKKKQCSRCGKPATFICSGCKKEWYCGKECQLDDWILHSKNCHN